MRAALIALCFCAVICAALWLAMQVERPPTSFSEKDSWPSDQPSTPSDAEARTAAESLRRVQVRATKPEGLPNPASSESSQGPAGPTRGPNDPRHAAIQARPSGTVKLEVWDKSTGRLVTQFRYVLYGPGVGRVERQISGGSGEVKVRLGMPANLRVEAEGYEPAEFRQIHLTELKKTRFIQVLLKRGPASGIR